MKNFSCPQHGVDIGLKGWKLLSRLLHLKSRLRNCETMVYHSFGMLLLSRGLIRTITSRLTLIIGFRISSRLPIVIRWLALIILASPSG